MMMDLFYVNISLQCVIVMMLTAAECCYEC